MNNTTTGFWQSTFNRDFNKMLVQVGATLTVVFGVSALVTRICSK